MVTINAVGRSTAPEPVFPAFRVPFLGWIEASAIIPFFLSYAYDERRQKYLRRRFQQKGAYEKIINTDQAVAGYHKDHATALSPASVSQEVQGVSGALLGTVLRTV